MKLSVWL